MQKTEFEHRDTLFLWAAIIGVLGSCAGTVFHWATIGLHWLFTGSGDSLVAGFASLPWWGCLLVPTLGGILAGWVLGMRKHLQPGDYLESVVIGDGRVPVVDSLVKSVSALFTISSGGSIGHEGPMVQLSAMLASVFGTFRKLPLSEQRLLVACGAAAGLASAYNAPISGAFFVLEIVLQRIGVSMLAPLVCATAFSATTHRILLGGAPLYPSDAVIPPGFTDLLLCCGFGVLFGVIVPLYLKGLRATKRHLSVVALPLIVRMGLGGALVGGIAIWLPEVGGNGHYVLVHLLANEWSAQFVLLVLLAKYCATAATFGSGAVGGIFTPTMVFGAGIGFVLASVTHGIFPGFGIAPEVMALVGLCAFLGAATGAPAMAILMALELTLDFDMVLPTMLAAVVASSVARRFQEKPIYFVERT